MSNDLPLSEPRSRRHIIRIAAVLGATAGLSALTPGRSEAAGRHSDPNFCAPLCVLRGTLIDTPVGAIPVELLQTGDLIRTVEGGFAPVTWIGRKTYSKREDEAWSADVEPVCVMRSAIAKNVPSRDLYLSPKHAIFANGYLIPVMFLINGATIRQGAFAGDVIEFFHVECARHQVMFAENCPVETFRLQDTYAGFDNAEDHASPVGAAPQPFAPVLGYWTLREDAYALLRSLGSAWVDMRDPIHVVYDRIAERAREMAVA